MLVKLRVRPKHILKLFAKQSCNHLVVQPMKLKAHSIIPPHSQNITPAPTAIKQTTIHITPPSLSTAGPATILPAAPLEVAELAACDVVLALLDADTDAGVIVAEETSAAPIVGRGALGSTVHPPAVELGQGGGVVVTEAT